MNSGSGVTVDSPNAAVFELRDGKISRVRLFLDHGEALRAGGLAEWSQIAAPKLVHVAVNDESGLALSWLSTFCSAGESSVSPMCSVGSVGH